MSTAIEFNNVSKLYRLGLVSTGALKDDLHRFWVTKILKKEDPYLKIGATNDRTTKGDSNYVWALKDIDFKVEQGDVVGIIGKNGAGKSTLLKLLSRVTGPTTGSIKVHGRIGSLLEVGTGFHPEMTGRENIFMNGAILGMTHKEIQSKLDEIIDFSGCERYIDTPVKRYSSGMTVRLGFAVAAHLEPEILVVDEVLAVGDAEFQKKAIGKMHDVSTGEGRTVLFVSHNMTSVRKLCNNGIVLNEGSVYFEGPIDKAIDEYMNIGVDKSVGMSISDYPRVGGCTCMAVFDSMEILNNNNEQSSLCCGRPVRFKFYVKFNEDVSDFRLSFDISDSFGNKLMTFPSIALSDGYCVSKGIHSFTCAIDKFPLTAGVYRLTLWCAIGNKTSDYIESLIPIEVDGDDYFGLGRKTSQNLLGKVVLHDYKWSNEY